MPRDFSDAPAFNKVLLSDKLYFDHSKQLRSPAFLGYFANIQGNRLGAQGGQLFGDRAKGNGQLLG